MLRRTKGRLLITLLVVTGLAGTMDNSSVTQRERKIAVTMLKEGKTGVQQRTKGLSEKQLNFTSATTPVSIRTCLLQMAYTEKELWENITVTLEQPANPEKRVAIKFSDEELVSMTERGDLASGSNTFKRANAPWKDAAAAVTSFKNMRGDHIKYMKTSTEDLRNHVVLTPAGWLDCYQYILVMSAETNRYIRQIEIIKAHPEFPAD